MPYFYEIISNIKQFREVSGKWTPLVEASAADNLFLSAEWLQTWCQVYENIIEQLLVIMVYNQNRDLVGAAPFYERCSIGLLPIRQIYFLGTGEPDAESVSSEYLDILSVRSEEAQVCEMINKALSARNIDWGRIFLCNMLEDSLANQYLVPGLKRNDYVADYGEAGVRYRIELPATWDEYVKQLDPAVRKQILTMRECAVGAGALEITELNTVNDLKPAMNHLVILHKRRWSERGQPGVFSSPRFLRFHEILMHKLLEKGQLKVHALLLDKKVVAILYNWRQGNMETYYQSSCEMRRGLIYPDLLVHSYAIEAAINDGLKYYDLMRSQQGSYKAGYGAEMKTMHSVQVFNPSLGGWVSGYVNRAWIYLCFFRQVFGVCQKSWGSLRLGRYLPAFLK